MLVLRKNSAYVLNDSFPILDYESNSSNDQVYFIVIGIETSHLLQKSTKSKALHKYVYEYPSCKMILLENTSQG